MKLKKMSQEELDKARQEADLADPTKKSLAHRLLFHIIVIQVDLDVLVDSARELRGVLSDEHWSDDELAAALEDLDEALEDLA